MLRALVSGHPLLFHHVVADEDTSRKRTALVAAFFSEFPRWSLTRTSTVLNFKFISVYFH